MAGNALCVCVRPSVSDEREGKLFLRVKKNRGQVHLAVESDYYYARNSFEAPFFSDLVFAPFLCGRYVARIFPILRQKNSNFIFAYYTYIELLTMFNVNCFQTRINEVTNEKNHL